MTVLITPEQYLAICDVIDRAKNDERSEDTDAYATGILSAIDGELVRNETSAERCARELEGLGWPSLAEDVRDGVPAPTLLRRLRDICEEDSDAYAVLLTYDLASS